MQDIHQEIEALNKEIHRIEREIQPIIDRINQIEIQNQRMVAGLHNAADASGKLVQSVLKYDRVTGNGLGFEHALIGMGVVGGLKLAAMGLNSITQRKDKERREEVMRIVQDQRRKLAHEKLPVLLELQPQIIRISQKIKKALKNEASHPIPSDKLNTLDIRIRGINSLINAQLRSSYFNNVLHFQISQLDSWANNSDYYGDLPDYQNTLEETYEILAPKEDSIENLINNTSNQIELGFFALRNDPTIYAVAQEDIFFKSLLSKLKTSYYKRLLPTQKNKDFKNIYDAYHPTGGGYRNLPLIITIITTLTLSISLYQFTIKPMLNPASVTKPYKFVEREDSPKAPATIVSKNHHGTETLNNSGSMRAAVVPCGASTGRPCDERAPRSKERCKGSACITPERFALIKAGRFTMGTPPSEEGHKADEQQHRVLLTRSFHALRTEVTQGEWQRVMGSNPSRFVGCGEDCPVERVSWFDALAFLNARSERDGLEACYQLSQCSGEPGGGCSGDKPYCTGGYACKKVTSKGTKCDGYRLPTEAEWEYMSRAGTTAATYNGDMVRLGKRNAPVLDPIAWYSGNSGAAYQGAVKCDGWTERQHQSARCGSHPVAKKRPNAWGLYDTLGNVWEWTWDLYTKDITTLNVDPSAPYELVRNNKARAFRGGGWGRDVRFCRAGDRVSSDPRGHSYSVGFRYVRTVPD